MSRMSSFQGGNRERIFRRLRFIFLGQENVWVIVKNKLEVICLNSNTDNFLVIALYCEVDSGHL